ncbi:Protein N-acetyltransferase, RimJ/RimL family [Soonwooa buanensis]|uniref:Protein N-acetyltransferase, RimJ/RimL family n=1 Tax=Soonwooa buanensis TaxID=619805 RepID=A0A1T5FP45_9FLAO|nr:GNAT family N-acetyltransferase [Soonwooa buanensis]SKB97949.1 Protein N-acetyltransferase, RimJ/RimL family [Soonwooa buanensis]
MKTILETSRFFLRELNTNDAESFFALNANPNVLKYTGDKAFNHIDDARDFLQNYKEYEKYGFGRWAIISKSNQEFVGWCGLKFHPETDEVDLGFRIFEEFWNQGIATETAKACLDYGFSVLKLQNIIGRAMSENKASISVLEKCGMQFSKNILLDGQKAVQYSISKT